MKRLALLALVAAACGGEAGNKAPATAASSGAGWVARSDANARLLLDVNAKYVPEEAANVGVEGLDDRVLDYTAGHNARLRADLATAKKELEARLAKEQDREVALDLKVLIASADRSLRSSKLHEDREVSFLNVAELVFGSLKSLLDERIPPARQKAAVKRLARYAGEGGTPLTDLAKADTLASFAAGGNRMPPAKMEVEKAIQNGKVLTDGIEALFKQFGVTGYEAPLATYRTQIAAYQKWLETDVLPRTRADFRLAPDIYAMRLEETGVDLAPLEVAALGHEGFDEIQKELGVVAAKIAKARNLPSSDYRDVLKELKKEQIVGAEILPLYEKTLGELEAIIQREHLVTLPKRKAQIRLATDAESAALPAPYLDPPRLIGNTGEKAVFVLPLSVPPKPGEPPTKFDDFSYAAAAWTLTAHEARPGHELQYASMVEAGMSIARAYFAFNSANVEGWGLYAEYIAQPYMPPEGQLVSLVLRLHRAAREFLDPELHLGKITPDQARAFLSKEVGLSTAFANSEVERYTFKSPGQATAYFYGFTRLLAIRQEVTMRQGPKFNLQRFDDFVISKGVLPPALLREAAANELR